MKQGNVDSEDSIKQKQLNNPESNLDFDIVMNNDTIDDLTPIDDINQFKEILCKWTYDKPCAQAMGQKL